jgi:hypothetical protein
MQGGFSPDQQPSHPIRRVNSRNVELPCRHCSAGSLANSIRSGLCSAYALSDTVPAACRSTRQGGIKENSDPCLRNGLSFRAPGRSCPRNEIEFPRERHIEYPFQSKTLATSKTCEGGLLDISHPAKRRQCEASHAGYDDSGRHHQ